MVQSTLTAAGYMSPPGRVSYPHLWTPNDYNDPPKYEITLLFPKEGCDLTEMLTAIDDVANEKWPQGLPPNFHHPLRDGDEKGDPNYDGMYFVRFSSKSRVGVIAQDPKVQITEESGQLYPGCYARVRYKPATYVITKKGKAISLGVTMYLNAVQKVRDGERLGSGISPDAAGDCFDEVPIEEYSDSDLAAVLGMSDDDVAF